MSKDKETTKVLYTEYNADGSVATQLSAHPFGLQLKMRGGISLIAWGVLAQLREQLEPPAEPLPDSLPKSTTTECNSDLLVLHTYADGKEEPGDAVN